MHMMASQMTSLTIVYSIVNSDAVQRKQQSSMSLAFVWGLHRWPVNSPHKGPVTQKMFPFDDIMMMTWVAFTVYSCHCWECIYFNNWSYCCVTKWEKMQLEQLEYLHFEDTPHCPMIIYTIDSKSIGPPIINSLRQRQNGRHNTFKLIFLNENIRILIKILLKFVPKVPINIIPALVQIMAWRRPGDKPLSEPMMVCLLMHICVTQPKWVKIQQVPITNYIIRHIFNGVQ